MVAPSPSRDPEHPPSASAPPPPAPAPHRRWPRPADPWPFWLAVLVVPALAAGLWGAALVTGWGNVLDAGFAAVVLGPLAATSLVGRIAGLSSPRTATLVGYSCVMTFAFVGAGLAFLFAAFASGCTWHDYGCGFP